MKDTCKPLRNAVAAVITGSVTYNGAVVPVYDEKVFTGEMPSMYILLGKQSEQDITEADCTWQTRSTLELWVIAKTGSEVSKDVIDDIGGTVLDLLIPLPTLDNFLQPMGLQIMGIRRESSVSGQVQISQTQSELQKVITLTANIIQLN